MTITTVLSIYAIALALFSLCIYLPGSDAEDRLVVLGYFLLPVLLVAVEELVALASVLLIESRCLVFLVLCLVFLFFFRRGTLFVCIGK